ncbi:MAG TPA: class I SAM-dependent methyltransferase [Thermoanaerobaculia bacterium]|nr:class I SAM-dependent methyltransferase [Thermoanaerobaculia bacterium]
MSGGDDPRGRFSGRVDAYVRSRPGYPPGLIPLLEREAGLDRSQTVADVGSGTGILTRLFLEFGNEVYAVEPNAKMRAAAEAAFEGVPFFRSVDGSAEDTTLPSESVDLVAAGQAFHWFAGEAARAEFARILRPPRTVALIWNDRRTEGSAFSRGYEALLRRHGTDYGAVDHKNLGPDVFEAFFRPGPWNRFAIPNRQTFDAEGLRARLLSSSYTPPPGDPRHPPMLDALGRLFAETSENGLVTMEYDTTVYVGTVTG